MRLIIDFWIDGYETEADMEAAAPEAVYELLSSAGTSVKVVSESEENKRMREALERCRGKFAEYAKHHAGKVRAFDQVLSQESKDALKKYDSNIAMAKMCEEALK